jgi:hypothetical protein
MMTLPASTQLQLEFNGSQDANLWFWLFLIRRWESNPKNYILSLADSLIQRYLLRYLLPLPAQIRRMSSRFWVVHQPDSHGPSG